MSGVDRAEADALFEAIKAVAAYIGPTCTLRMQNAYIASEIKTLLKRADNSEQSKLNAAAPELLAALIALYKSDGIAAPEVYEAARSAIEKATGRPA